MSIIKISHLTKDYGNGKGVFDVSLSITKGEVYGYLGPNGAGKSTTIRHLMGFSKPDSGSVEICSINCWDGQKIIQKTLGYLPGEISFSDDMTGLQYLKLIAKMRGMKDFSYAEELFEFFEINPDTDIKRMSKGMKQKIAIVSAFMHKPDVFLLDEPSSGLDPIMQNRFIELVEKVKEQGKTVLLSSHIFEEVEKTCDRIGMIRNGKLINEITVDELRHSCSKIYKFELENANDHEKIKATFPTAQYNTKNNKVTVFISDDEINRLIIVLSECKLRYFREEKHTLEEYFMQFYGGEDK